MPLRIEAADADDIDALVDLWVELARGQRGYGSHLLGEPNRDPIRDALARHLVTDGLRVARAIDREAKPAGDEVATIVGFVMFDLESGAYEQDVTRGVVRNLYVEPSRRDEGIGADLLAAAERALAAAGADVVALEAMMANEAARRFYTGHGYTPHRVEFEKPLGEGSDTHSREDR